MVENEFWKTIEASGSTDKGSPDEPCENTIENLSIGIKAKFRPSKAWLEIIEQRGAELLSQISDEDLSDFTE